MVTKKNSADRSSLLAPIAVIAILLPAAGAGIWWMQKRSAEPAAQTTISAEGKLYTRNLKLSGVEMKATANYAGAAVVEILGNITNAGDRPLARVELNCVFYDTAGLVVLRERVAIVRSTLAPGETKPFRLPFEGIPQSWNQAMPQLVIAHIAFA